MLRMVSHPIGPLPPLTAREASWNTALDASLIAAPGTEAALARLHQPGALVVTTGQQPGLFTGPLYTVHKALAAAALARALERRWQRPVVPMFWIAGDDHDYVEASSAAWFDADNRLTEWCLPRRAPTAPQRSASEEPLPARITEGLALLESTLPSGLERDRTLDWLRRHYTIGATIHLAYAGAVAELLAPAGVLCFDATSAALKHAQVPLLQRALDDAAAIDQTLAALPDAGTGIAAGEGATLVFVTTEAGRDRLLIDGDGFIARRSRQRFTAAELGALLQSAPERFSANVLLRPIVEGALLPTVAYVAGPGELKYQQRQCAALYPLFGVTQQTPVPRWSGSLVPRWADRLLSRLHTTAAAVTEDDGTLARAILERDFPGDARQAIDALRKQLVRSTGVIAAAGKRVDPVLDRAVQGRMRRLKQITDDVEGVFLRHLRRRSDIAHAQFQRLRDELLPSGKPQERVLTAATFLARYGDAWLGAITTETDIWAESLPETRA